MQHGLFQCDFANTSAVNDSAGRYNIFATSGFVAYITRVANSTYNLFEGWTGLSDEKLKSNIKPLTDGLITILAVQPKIFNFKNSMAISKEFIAQDIQKIPALAHMVSESSAVSPDGTPYLGVAKEPLIPYLVLAIQEQQAIIQKLMDRVQELEER